MLENVSFRSNTQAGGQAPARVNGAGPVSPDLQDRLSQISYKYSASRGELSSNLTPTFPTPTQPDRSGHSPFPMGWRTSLSAHPFAAACLRALKAARRWWLERQAAKSLHALDDALLKDIGISRSEIDFVVRSRAGWRGPV